MVFSESFDPQKDIPDLTGKVIIVTGGNAGIGFTAIKHLARRGAKVYLGARSEEKAKAAIERLITEGIGSGEVHYLHLDLSDPKLAKAAAEDFLTKETRLDVLVNNAAQTLLPYKRTLYDIQDVVLINYFGTVTFTLGLIPLLEKTAKEPGTDVRIVNVITTGIKLVPAGKRFRNRDDFNEEYAKTQFPKLLRYTSSKLALTIWGRELQRRFDDKNVPIIVIASDPGGVHTDGNKNYARTQGAILSRIYIGVSYLFFRSAEKGSYGSVFAAASPKVRAEAESYKGSYLDPNRKNLKAPNPQVYDQELATELWQTTETLLTEIGAWQDVI